MTKHISGLKANMLVAKGAVVVDIRDPVSFRDTGVSGSVNLSLRQLGRLLPHPRTTQMILVGDPADPDTLRAAVNYVTGFGFTKVDTVASVADFKK